MQKVIFQLRSLDCPGCAKKIEDRLSRQKGVKSVVVYSRLGKVRTEYNEQIISKEKLGTELKNCGYQSSIWINSKSF